LATERVLRRLAAVLAADVAGYSRLMGADEEGTLSRLKGVRTSLVDPAIAFHRGRIVKTTGDGLLAEFASAVDAVRGAEEIQRAMADQNVSVPQNQRIELRIGIHVGDIIIDDNDIFGDGVNVAARLEGIAEAGGICMSNDAYRQVRGKVDSVYDDMGPQLLKNIAEPMQAWRARLQGQSAAKAQPALAAALVLPDKPSIAVLPFQNMSGDQEQEYFADGIVEDIITALSRFKSLFVIARNSSFTYKGKAVDIKQVGRELGVRYVLEGSVRKAGGRVRITGQLIEAATGAHLWADRYDGKLEDVFGLQDQVTSSVVGQLVAQVEFAESERAKRKPTANLDAYDCYLRGRASIWKWTKASCEEAQTYFSRAIELDEDFAIAHAFAGQMYTLRKQNRWMVDVEEESAEAIRLARRAIELGSMDDLALCMGGFVLAYVGGELDLAAECIGRGLSLNPNLAVGWNFSGWVHVYLGEQQTALEHARRAERLSPRDPNMLQVRASMAFAQFFDGQYSEAGRLAERMADEFPTFVPALRIMAASYALAGNLNLAERAAKKSLELDPSQRVAMLASHMPLRRVDDREKWEAGLLRAGFPP
jgi:TolB-like protein/class 3 adenylate cyclase/tetratricopeptide (TPR) repeat protein